MNVLAIDVGGTKFTLAVFAEGRMIRRESRSTDREAGRDAMLPAIEEIVRGWMGELPIDGCGIGFGGPVDFSAQRVALSTHAGGWRDFDFPAWITERFGLRSVMDNDANVGALGEGAYGAGVDCDPLFYMTLSTGIGGGIVSKGQVWRGADSYGGEIGHLTIKPGSAKINR